MEKEKCQRILQGKLRANSQRNASRNYVEFLMQNSNLGQPLPYAENAEVDIRKLRDYYLNPNHDQGKHKARLFSSILAVTIDDTEDLRRILLEVVKTQEAQLGRRDQFGQRYTVDFMLEWQGKAATVRSAWIIEHNSNVPRLTTCYPL